MYNVCLSPWGANGDQKAGKCNTRGLAGSIINVKCDFRLECFSTLMFLLTYFVDGLVCIKCKKSQMKQVH